MWKNFLEQEMQKEYFIKLQKFLDTEYKHQTVYPKQSDVFNVFKTELEDIKVVILGQDPYHNPNQANGLAFSSVKIPPSLRNMFKELQDDLGYTPPLEGDLTHWQTEGVFLLNTILTVRENEPLSHQKQGWEIFTDTVIKHISETCDNIVFILWGNNARSKKKLISEGHLILESAHPSPLSASRGFFKSKPFSQTNEYLIKKGKKPINWEIKPIDLFNQL
jgi:uracil-DNA glycosylase